MTAQIVRLKPWPYPSNPEDQSPRKPISRRQSWAAVSLLASISLWWILTIIGAVTVFKAAVQTAGKNEFEQFPRLALWMERLANSGIEGIGLSEWGEFCSAVNDVAARASEAEAAWGYVNELTKALTHITGGGSEFFIRRHGHYMADTRACIERVRLRDKNAHERIVELTYQLKAAGSAPDQCARPASHAAPGADLSPGSAS